MCYNICGLFLGNQTESQDQGPWYRSGRPPPPIKSRAPLQRQHSAGQTSLLSSHSGKFTTLRPVIRKLELLNFFVLRKKS